MNAIQFSRDFLPACAGSLLLTMAVCAALFGLLVRQRRRQRWPAAGLWQAAPLKPRADVRHPVPAAVRELPPPQLLPWQRLRPCRRGTRLNAGDGTPPCQELHTAWWGWPLELAWRLWRNLFAPPLLRVEYPPAILPQADDTELRDALMEANDLLRGMHAIASREGAHTNWCAFLKRVEAALERQHQLCLWLNLYETTSTSTHG